MTLSNRRIAILISPRGTEDPEFAKPKSAVEAAGATVTVISLKKGDAKTVNNDLDPGSSYTVDKAIDECRRPTSTDWSCPAVASARTRCEAMLRSFRSSGTSSRRASPSASSAMGRGSL